MSTELGKLKCDCGCESFIVVHSGDSGFSVTTAICNSCQCLFVIGENAPQDNKEEKSNSTQHSNYASLLKAVEEFLKVWDADTRVQSAAVLGCVDRVRDEFWSANQHNC